MRNHRTRIGLIALLLVALFGAGATTAIASTFKDRATQGTFDPANKPVQQVSGLNCSAAGGCDLWATQGTLNVGGTNYNVWGYGTASGQATIPGPTIVANAGDVLTVRLHNDLPLSLSTSLDVPEIAAAGKTTPAAFAPGGTVTYSFTANNAGTLIYQPGADTLTGTVQMAKGMAGVLVVRPAAGCGSSPVLGCAYGAELPAFQGLTADDFHDEALVAISDFDPALLQAANPTTYPMVDFAPTIHLINGKAFPDTEVIDATVNDKVLLRYANLGPIDRTMGLLGLRQRLVGRDGHPLADAQDLIAPMFGPGQTAEAMVTVPPSARPGQRFAIADQSRRMRANALELGGALTFINVWRTAVASTDQPTVTNPTIDPLTVAALPDVTAAAIPLHFTFTNSGGSIRYFLDQIGLAAASTPANATDGTVSIAQLANLSNGTHVIWIQRSSNGTNWSDGVGLPFFVDRGGPTMRETSVDPAALNLAAGNDSVLVRTTADTSGEGTANVTAGRAQLWSGSDPCASIPGAATGDGVSAPLALDGDPVPFSDPGFVGTQVQALAGTITIPGATAEGLYHVSVIGEDALNHWSANGAGTFQCQSADVAIDKTAPVKDTGPTAADTNHAVPAVTNGINGYTANPTWQDSVWVEVQLVDPLHGGVQGHIEKIEGFLEGSIGYVANPAPGTGFEFIPTDGSYGGTTERAFIPIPLATVRTLSRGLHNVYVRGLDDAGNWGALEVGATITLDPDAPAVAITAATTSSANNVPRNVSVSIAAVAAGNETITTIERAVVAVGVTPAAGDWATTGVVSNPTTAAKNRIATISVNALPKSSTIWVRVTDSNNKQTVVNITPAATIALTGTYVNDTSTTRSLTVNVSASAAGPINVSSFEYAMTNTPSPAPSSWTGIPNNQTTPNSASNPRDATVTIPNLPRTAGGTIWIRVTDSLGTQLVLSRTFGAPTLTLNSLSSTSVTSNGTTRSITVNATGAAVAPEVVPAGNNAFRVAFTTGAAPTNAQWNSVNVGGGAQLSKTMNTTVNNLSRTTAYTVWVQVVDSLGGNAIVSRNLGLPTATMSVISNGTNRTVTITPTVNAPQTVGQVARRITPPANSSYVNVSPVAGQYTYTLSVPAGSTIFGRVRDNLGGEVIVSQAV